MAKLETGSLANASCAPEVLNDNVTPLVFRSDVTGSLSLLFGTDGVPVEPRMVSGGLGAGSSGGLGGVVGDGVVVDASGEEERLEVGEVGVVF